MKKETFDNFLEKNLKEEIAELREKRQKCQLEYEKTKNYLIENTREQIAEEIKKILKEECEVGPCTRSITVYINLEQNEENFIISIYTDDTPRAERHKILFPKEGGDILHMYSFFDKKVYISKDGCSINFWKDVLDEESSPWSWIKEVEIYLD